MAAVSANQRLRAESRAYPSNPEVVMEGGSAVQARDLRFAYAAQGMHVPVIDGLSLQAQPGEFLAVVGPSGCGKTTLLRLLAGLLRPDAGEVDVDGHIVAGTTPGGLGLVFQDYSRALLPWRTALRNVELGLEGAGLSRSARRERARAALAAVQLPGVEARYPAQLSGGMQQRLQIARELVTRPSLLLMDEPFASLDALTRFTLEDAVLELWRTMRPTVLFVTHDLDEAVYLADRILVLCRHPARVVRELVVDLPRPREQGATRADQTFVELRYQLFETIRDLTGGDMT